jgi:hypothetical protein
MQHTVTRANETDLIDAGAAGGSDLPPGGGVAHRCGYDDKRKRGRQDQNLHVPRLIAWIG